MNWFIFRGCAAASRERIAEENGKPMPLEKHVYRIGDQKTDIVISGLGWITLVGAGQEMVVYAPKGVGVLVRPSLI